MSFRTKQIQQRLKGTSTHWIFAFAFFAIAMVHVQAQQVWTCGSNLHGQIGDGTTVNRSSVVQAGNTSDWRQIDAGYYHSMAIKNDGTLWAWGFNLYGSLGDGTTTDRYSPVQIGTDTNWRQVSCGVYHNVAIKSDGTMWAWGYNDQGEIGDGTVIWKNFPVQVGSANNWLSVSCGGYHSHAVKTDGSLWAWGDNEFGTLGDGTTTNRLSPIQIGSATDWSAVAGGLRHTLALKTDGTLWGCGRNFSGEVGDGTTTQRNSFVRVGSASNWRCVFAGGSFTCAIATDSTLWAWGYNASGQLGDGTTTNKLSPIQIGSSTNWLSVDCGFSYTIALKSDHSLWTWGDNQFGQLADGTTTSRTTPANVATAFTWSSARAGVYHLILLRACSFAVSAGSGVAICKGDSVQIGASPQSGVSYAWSTQSAGLSNYSIANPYAKPSVTTTYYLNATNANQCIGKDSVVVTVNALPPVGDSTLPTQCLLSTMSYSFSANVSGDTFNWRAAGGAIVGPNNQANVAVKWTQAGSDTLFCTVTTALGCSKIARFFIHINDLPLTNAGPDTSVCFGSGVKIGGLPSSGTSPYFYTWQPASGLSATNIAQPIASPLITTSYSVLVSDANGCVYRDTVLVSVIAPPTLNVPQRTMSICNSSDTIISVAASGGTAPYSYAWLPTAGLSAPTLNTTRAKPQQSTKYYVTVTDARGCSAKDSVSVTVRDLPTPLITSSRTPVICTNDSIVLSTTIPFASYLWSTGSTDATIKVAQAGFYSLRVVDQFGCVGTSNSFEVKQGIAPAANIVGASSACPGSMASYFTDIAGSYSWSLSGGGVIQSGAFSDSVSVQWTTQGTWTVSIHKTSADGCSSDSSMTVVISTTLSPKLSLLGSTTLCVGDTAKLSAPGFQSYRWSDGETSPSIAVTSSGKYFVEVSNADGCKGISDTIEIQASTLPKLHPHIKASDSVLCNGTAVLLSADTTYSSYKWSTGESTRSISTTVPGSYNLIVTNSDGCTANASFKLRAVIPASVSVTANGPTSLCEGDSVKLSANGSFARCAWSDNTIGSSIVVTKSGSYSATVTSIDGCNASSQAVLVTVNPAPHPSISGALSACLNSIAPYALASSKGLSVEWIVSNGTLVSGQGASVAKVLWDKSGSCTIGVKTTDLVTGCAGTAVLNVVVFDSLQVHASADRSDICEGDSATINADKGFDSYQWFVNTTPISGATASSYVVKSSGSYSVLVRSNANCLGSSQQIPVVVHPLPPKPTVLQKGNVLYTNNAAVTYQWYKQGALISGATNDTLMSTTSGSYTLVVRDGNGCESISDPVNFVDSNSVKMTLVAPVMSAGAGDKVRVPILLKNYQGDVYPTPQAFTLQLHFDQTLLVPDGNTPKGIVVGQSRILSISASSTFPQDTIAIVELSATLGLDSCTDLSLDAFSWSIPNTTVLNQNGTFCLEGICYANGTPRFLRASAETAINQLYPNPVADLLTLEYGVAESGLMKISVVDNLGRECKTIAAFNGSGGVYSLRTSLSDLPQGSYFVVLSTTSERTARPFLLLR